MSTPTPRKSTMSEALARIDRGMSDILEIRHRATEAATTAVEQIRGVSVSAFRETITAPAGAQASEIQPNPIIGLNDPEKEVFIVEEIIDLNDPNCPIVIVPSYWSKGALLNVRNRGDHYCITLYPEEFDPRSPERAMMFPNSWETQDFVSRWYSRETADPRAR